MVVQRTKPAVPAEGPTRVPARRPSRSSDSTRPAAGQAGAGQRSNGGTGGSRSGAPLVPTVTRQLLAF
ncbi:MAG TPA: hypothetical protein VET90_04125, partial [Candidatus Binatus sp.]|nr:hypothetical protein [Candidatus Binatus sp.]